MKFRGPDGLFERMVGTTICGIVMVLLYFASQWGLNKFYLEPKAHQEDLAKVLLSAAKNKEPLECSEGIGRGRVLVEIYRLQDIKGATVLVGKDGKIWSLEDCSAIK